MNKEVLETENLKDKVKNEIQCRKKDREDIKLQFLSHIGDFLRGNTCNPPARMLFAPEHFFEEVQKWQDSHPDFAEEAGRPELPFEKTLNFLKSRYDSEKQLMLMKYMSRIRKSAADKMMEDEEFASKFIDSSKFNAVILSVDIRRSTKLMLKCRSAEIYAEFINELTKNLTEAVKLNYGIYDKFTGDGLLAIFPDFYSGKEALLHAIVCARDCEKIFNILFREYGQYFDMSAEETGLGAGIDCGEVFRAGVEMEYTVVGAPVVYACRFSSAPAHHVYLTENAEVQFKALNFKEISLEETSIEIKHEEPQKAWDVKLEKPLEQVSGLLEKPQW